jgi:GST-like protein
LARRPVLIGITALARHRKETRVIDVYTWTTGNSRKIPIFLEEAAVPYRLHMVDIHNGDQHKPDFVKICPNSKVPAIVDQDGPGGRPLTLFESGAILIYLAEKTGRFMPTDGAGRYHVIEWVMFQMANVGPMFGQAHHFLGKAPEKMPYAIDRYVKEAARICKVMEQRLGEVDYLAGDYSIADMTTYVWLRNPKNIGQKLDDYPNIKHWFEAIDTRPAVQRAHKAVEDAAKQYKAMREAV